MSVVDVARTCYLVFGGGTMRSWIATIALAVAFGGGAAAQEWAPREQPNLPELFANAPELEVQEVGDRMNSTTLGPRMTVPNPDGETIDIIQWYFRAYSGPTTGILIDTGSGEIKEISISDNLQIHISGTQIGLDGKLYITTPWWYSAERKGMELMVYDPATNEFEQRGVIAPQLGYENRPMTLGTNGKIYGASSYPHLRQVGAYEIDTETGEVTDFGPMGPSYAPHMVWVSGVAADDRYLYIATRNNPRYIIAYDRETGESEVLVEAENVGGSTSVSQGRYGVTGAARGIKGAEDQGMVRYWLYEGKAIVRTDDNPPWKEPVAPEPPRIAWPENVDVFTANTHPDTEGNAEIWYLVGLEGEGDTPEERGWVQAEYQVPVYPRTLNHLIELPDGRIFGTASGYGGGNFIYDPEADETEYLGKIRGLSQYSRIQHDGIVYMSGYPSSPLYIFESDSPWTTNKWVLPGERPIGEDSRDANPRRRLYLREWSGTHYARTAAVDAEGRIYFSGVWARDASSGGLAWWDPETQEGGGFWEGLTNVGVHHITTSNDGKLIVLSAYPVNDTLRDLPRPDHGQLIVYDIEAGEIVNRFEPLAGVRNPGAIADAGGTRVIGIADDPEDRGASILYGVDVMTGETAFTKLIPASGVGREFRKGPDGAVYTILGGTLVRILTDDGTVEIIGKVGRSGHLAFSGGDVYIGGGELMRRVSGVYME